MATIEERATLDADKFVGKEGNFGAWQSHRLAYIRVATEQDRIAREEERERCIEKACEQYRKELTQMVRIMNLAHKGSGNIIVIDGSVDDFRKALEGGEV